MTATWVLWAALGTAPAQSAQMKKAPGLEWKVRVTQDGKQVGAYSTRGELKVPVGPWHCVFDPLERMVFPQFETQSVTLTCMFGGAAMGTPVLGFNATSQPCQLGPGGMDSDGASVFTLAYGSADRTFKFTVETSCVR